MKKSGNGHDGFVNIATLKAQLAKYLRLVKSGKELVILDHKLPVARLIPCSNESLSLETYPPKAAFSEVFKLEISASPRKATKDTTQLLKDERGER